MRVSLVLLLLVCVAFSPVAQPRKISGIIVDHVSDTPLKNVNVFLLDTPVATSTNDKGEFELTIDWPARHTKINASHVGYATKQIVLGSSNMIKVSLDKEYVQMKSLFLHGFPKEEVPYAPVTQGETTIDYRVVESSATYYKGMENLRILLGNGIFKEVNSSSAPFHILFTISHAGRATNVEVNYPSLAVKNIVTSLLSDTKWTPATQRGVNTPQHFDILVSTARNPIPLEDFFVYIGANVKYPKEAVRSEAQGVVHAEFSISDNGAPFNVRIVSDIGSGCGEEVERVLLSVPPSTCRMLVKAAGADKFSQTVYFAIGKVPKIKTIEPSSSDIYPLGSQLVLLPVDDTQKPYKYIGKAKTTRGLTADEITAGIAGDWTYAELSEALRDKSNAKRLALRGRLLEVFPPEIVKLKRLTFLDLEANLIETLPDNINELKDLRWLFLPYNNLKTLPASIGELKNLMLLGLANNKLESIPPPIFKLSYLEGLDLSGNKIATIPEELMLLSNLKTLILTDNPIDSNEIEGLRSRFPGLQIIF